MISISILDLCTVNTRETQDFINDVEWLVYEEKKFSFYNLCQSDQEQLIGKLLAALEDNREWLLECQDSDVLMNAFARSLITPSARNKNYYLSLMKTSAISYFSEYIDDYFTGVSYAYKQSIQDKNIDDQIDFELTRLVA